MDLSQESAVPYINDNAIVIETHKSRERDKLVVLLSREHGLLKCIARRAIGASSKFGTALEILTHLRVQLFLRSQEAEIHTLSQATLLQPSPLLSTDFETLACGSFLCELTSAVACAGQADPELFHTLSRARALLAGDSERRALACGFLAKVLQIQGVQPSLNCCGRCGQAPDPELEGGTWVYAPESGAFYCPKCRPETSEATAITPTILRKLACFMLRPLKESIGQKLLPEEAKRISKVLRQHAEHHLHLSVRSARFLLD